MPDPPGADGKRSVYQLSRRIVAGMRKAMVLAVLLVYRDVLSEVIG